MAKAVNEDSTCYLTVNMYDKDGVLAAPTSSTYEVHDKDSGTEMKAATAFGPASSVEITLVAAINAIQDDSKARETRVVTIKADYGAGDEVTDDYEYPVRNLQQVP